jgi:SAM-dependent methyltransferase
MNQFQTVETDFDFFLRHTNEIETEWPKYLDQFLRLLKPGTPQKIMEYGPGTGYMMKRIFENDGMKQFYPYLEVVLIEPSPHYQDSLQNTLGNIPIQSLTIYANIAEYSGLAGTEGSIDIIMSNHVFYYVEHFKEEFHHLNRVLKSGGYLLTSLCLQEHALIKAYVENCKKMGVPQRKHEPRDIVAEFVACNFTITREIVRSKLEFLDTVPNRMAIHRFIMLEEETRIPPSRLCWLDGFKVGEVIRIPLVDQFLTMQKN